MITRSKRWTLWTLGLGAILLGLIVRDSPVAAGDRRDHHAGVVPISNTWEYELYSHLSARWWQWLMAQPYSSSPVFDSTGAHAYGGQPLHEHLFFLAGSYAPSTQPNASAADRTIKIPAGTWLYFPVLNASADNVGPNPDTGEHVPWNKTSDELRALIAPWLDDPITIYATIDGVPVRDLLDYRVQSPVYRYTLPKTDSLYQYFGSKVPGVDWPTTHVYPAVADGYYLLMEPLPPGKHIIKFGGEESSGFKLDITYHITVLPGRGCDGEEEDDD